MKKSISILSVVLSIIMAFSVCACGEQVVDDGTVSLVSVSINPGIELVVDGTNKVTTVKATNRDGEVLLYGESGIVGADIETAIDKITALAVEYGYLNDENSVVDTSVSSSSEAKASSLLSKINAKITATAGKSNLSVTTDGASAYTLLKKMQEFKAQYPDNEAVQNLSVADFKLVCSAVETGEVTVEVALTLDDEALIEIIENNYKTVESYALSEFEEYKKLAESVYARAEAGILESVYKTYYHTADQAKIYLGIGYETFRVAQISLSSLAELFVALEDVRENTLPSIAATGVATALGVEVSEIADKDGKVSIASIEAYADRTFKNLPSGASVETEMAKIDSAIETMKSMLKTVSETAVSAQQVTVQQIIEKAKETVNILNAQPGFIGSIPQLNDIKETLNGKLYELDAIMENIATKLQTAGQVVTSADLIEAAEACKVRADALLVEIKADLTDTELAQIETMRESAKALLVTAKNAFDTTMNMAKNTVENIVKNAKEELKASIK